MGARARVGSFSTTGVAILAWLLCAGSPRAVRAQAFAAGLHVGGPVGASLAAGVMFSDPHAEEPRGAFALVEPGLRGGRISAGYELSRGALGSYISGRVSLLRTWRVVPQRTYAGMEIQLLPLFAIGGRLGVFVPLRGDPRPLWLGDLCVGL